MSAKLFVGNLNPNTTKSALADFLRPAGTVLSVTIPTDRNTGRPRGFAFVEFGERDEAKAAIETSDGLELDGNALHLSWAREREEAREGRGRKGGSSGIADDDEFGGREPSVWKRERDRFDDEEGRRVRRRHHGKHGSDRKRGRGTRRVID